MNDLGYASDSGSDPANGSSFCSMSPDDLRSGGAKQGNQLQQCKEIRRGPDSASKLRNVCNRNSSRPRLVQKIDFACVYVPCDEQTAPLRGKAFTQLHDVRGGSAEIHARDDMDDVRAANRHCSRVRSPGL